MSEPSALVDAPVPTRQKLSAAWAAVMFCYIYADYFELYVPGKLQGMLAGRMEPLGAVNQGLLVGTGVMLMLPSLMILLSLVLPARASRWANIVVGAVYTAIQILVASRSGWSFYVGFGVVEALLTAWVVASAWRWPRSAALAPALVAARAAG